MPTPLLSLIVPAHNEERRLPETLEQIFGFLQTQAYLAEVVVVENGSQDRTLEIAQGFARQYPHLRVLSNSASGKGRAVKRGMLEAWGEYRFMYDADASMPVAEVNRFFPPALQNCDIAIGSREAPGAVRYNEPPYRHLGGRLVNSLIRMLALPGLQDTQCGFKCFRAAVAEDLFRCQTLNGWSFDIELLYIARLRGYRIAEIPIDWYFNSDSKLNAVQDALKMVMDILRIRRNALLGAYSIRGQGEKV
ncbi:MAG TPA: dolichyl-phosphate beta-glucosyltransferase [Anaerolineales bacterium]